MKKYITLLLCAWGAVSCNTSRMLIGDVRPKEPMVEVSKEHNAHFIGGLVKTGKTIAEEHVGTAENYAVVTRNGFGDLMLSMVTAGIYTPTTTKYYIPVRYMDSFSFVPRAPVHKTRGSMLMFEGGLVFGMGGYKSSPSESNPFYTDEKIPLGTTFGITIAYGYMINPHIQVGVGIGAERVSTEGGDVWDNDYYSRDDLLLTPFLRGRYMLFDAKHTPFAGLDMGLLLCGEGAKTSFFVTPHVGYQMQVGMNGYLNLNVGIRIGNAKSEEEYAGKTTYRCGGLAVKVGYSFML